MGVLEDMQQDAPDQIEAIESSIEQVQNQIDELDEQITAITDDLCGVAESNLTAYLDGTKLVEFIYLDSDVVNYGANYGTIDYDDGGITDWRILDSTGNVIYSLTVNWDGDVYIQKLINDYEFGNDYLTRPLTSGATYGLIPSKSALNSAKSLLEENKTQVEDSVNVFEDYK
jgi:hypothetical protein